MKTGKEERAVVETDLEKRTRTMFPKKISRSPLSFPDNLLKKVYQNKKDLR